MIFYKKEIKKKRVSFMFYPSVFKKLKEMAEKSKVSMTSLIEQMIERAFDEMQKM